MNQIMPVGNGKGVVIAIERKVDYGELERFAEAWRERFPEVRCFMVGEAQIVAQGSMTMFQFTGNDISPTFVAEFQKWWEGVTYG